MRKLWKNKIFQVVFFILIASTVGIIYAKISSIQFLLGNWDIIDSSFTLGLVKDIKFIKILVLTIWGVAMGLYINFIYSINKTKL